VQKPRVNMMLREVEPNLTISKGEFAEADEITQQFMSWTYI